jgi:serine/threonine protein kinase
MSVVRSQLEQGAEIGGYRIDEQIGRGGMGVVYRVTNVALDRVYALKVLSPELAEDDQFRQRFQREMRLAASLDHPHVITVYYAGEQDAILFLAMDYVDGSDLRELLIRNGSIDPPRAVELLTQVGSALDAAHARGLVHRDIKPANIMITLKDGEEHAYLTDFGLAKRHDSHSGLTMTGAVMGTVDYIAPEQVLGEPTDARTDIYALGCVFFQMLMGRVPYEREHSIATLFAHMNAPPPPLEGDAADGFPELKPVLERAMAKKPEDRYLSAGDFARDAAAALSGTRYTGGQTMVATGEARPGGKADSGITHTAQSASPAVADALPGQDAETTNVTDRDSPRPPGEGLPPGRRLRPLRRYRWPALGVLVLVVAMIAAVILATSGGSVGSGGLYAAVLRPVPDNHVTGSGTAAVRLHGNEATFTVDVTGLINAPHAIHLHAFGQGTCPPASAGHVYNGHLAISTTDGLKYYGPMVAALTLTGDTSPNSMLAASRYPATGTIHYQRTIPISSSAAAAIRHGTSTIVVHGIDYNHNGRYDNVLSHSELEGTLPQEATAPALCGVVLNASQTRQVG